MLALRKWLIGNFWELEKINKYLWCEILHRNIIYDFMVLWCFTVDGTFKINEYIYIYISKHNFQWIFETLFSMIDTFIVYISDPRQHVHTCMIYVYIISNISRELKVIKFWGRIFLIFHRQRMMY